jgi:hypothetical protein
MVVRLFASWNRAALKIWDCPDPGSGHAPCDLVLLTPLETTRRHKGFVARMLDARRRTDVAGSE